MANANPVLSFENLSVGHRGHTVLQNVSGSIYSGDCIHLQGTNGSGKSTLMQTLAGVLPAIAGRVDSYAKVTGYTPQHAQINPILPLSLKEALSLAGGSATLAVAELESFALLHCKDKFFHECSGGEQQRFLLCRAFINQPELLILDEPSTALDAESQTLLFERINGYLKSSKFAVLLSEHSERDAELVTARWQIQSGQLHV